METLLEAEGGPVILMEELAAALRERAQADTKGAWKWNTLAAGIDDSASDARGLFGDEQEGEEDPC